MIQNIPIDIQSVTGLDSQSLVSNSFNTVTHPSERDNKIDSAAYLPFAVELEKAVARSQAAQNAVAADSSEVVVASPGPEFSFEVPKEVGFKLTEIETVDDQSKTKLLSTSKTQAQANQVGLVFSDHSQRVAIGTKIEAKAEKFESRLGEESLGQEVESPVVYQTNESGESLPPDSIEQDSLMVGQPDEMPKYAKQIDAASKIAPRTSVTRMIANNAYVTPASASGTQVDNRVSIQTIDTQSVDTQINVSQTVDTPIRVAQPTVTQINPEPAWTPQLVDAPSIDLQTNLESAIPDPTVDAQTIDPPTRKIVESPKVNTPASVDPSATVADPPATTKIEAARTIPVEFPNPKQPVPVVAAEPSPAPSSVASQIPVEPEIDGARPAPVDPEATINVSQEIVETRKTIAGAASPEGREVHSVETVSNEQRVSPKAESQSSRNVEPSDSDLTSSQEFFSQSEDETTDVAPKPVKVSQRADHGIHVPAETDFEWVTSDPKLQSDRSKPTQPIQLSHHEIHVQVPANRLGNETLARPNSFDPSLQEMGRIVSERVSETLIQEIQVDGRTDSKHLKLYLHPEELGKLTVQVGWESESIIAKIVATELATSEMLNRDKGWLMDSLQANGLEFDSFEVSYEGSTNRHAFQQNGESAAPAGERGTDPANTDTNTGPAIDGQGSVVNVIA